MRIEELEVYLTDVEVEDLLDGDELSHMIRRAVEVAIEVEVTRWTREFTQDMIRGAKDNLRERIEARVGPRLDAVFQSVVDEMDKLDDDQLVEEVFG